MRDASEKHNKSARATRQLGSAPANGDSCAIVRPYQFPWLQLWVAQWAGGAPHRAPLIRATRRTAMARSARVSSTAVLCALPRKWDDRSQNVLPLTFPCPVMLHSTKLIANLPQ